MAITRSQLFRTLVKAGWTAEAAERLLPESVWDKRAYERILAEYRACLAGMGQEKRINEPVSGERRPSEAKAATEPSEDDLPW